VTDGTKVQAALEHAAAARTERAGLTERLEAARSYLVSVEARVAERRAALDAESQDVERLESFSPTRILATLKGSRSTDLERQAAERDAARYAVAEAEARLESARRDCDSLTTQIEALGDVDGNHARALAAKEKWVGSHDTGVAGALADIAERRGVLVARDKEAREAHEAGVRASHCLSEAREHLGGAESWSTWDTFGGGLLSDLAKRQRMDQATQMLHAAEHALVAFSRELADLDLPPVAGVKVGNLGGTFDMFFDNIFSDMATRQRIQQAAGAVEHTLQVVQQALQVVAETGRSLAVQIIELDQQRERILLHGTGAS